MRLATVSDFDMKRDISCSYIIYPFAIEANLKGHF